MSTAEERGRPQAFVLASVWHDDNKGDSAIAEGVLELLGQALPGAATVVASMLDEAHPAFPSAYRHLTRRHSIEEVVPSIVPKPEMSGVSALELLRWSGRTTYALTALAFATSTRLARAVRRSTLVVANGGHTLYSAPGVGSIVRLIRILYPYWVARRLGRPYVVFGQSLGPFAPGIGRQLVRRVLAGAHAVWVREELSQAAALELGVEASRVRVIPDPAFLLRPVRTEAVPRVQQDAGLLPGKYGVITVRQAYERQARGAVTLGYLKEIAKLVAGLLETGVVERVAIVAHCLGPVPNEDDRTPSRELKAMLDRDDVVVVEDDLTPGELAALYGDASWVVGTRFHSVILALVAGTPTVAISYFGPKTHGIMRMLGLERLCFDLANLDANAVLAAIEGADTKQLRVDIATAVDGLRSSLLDCVPELQRAAGAEH